MKYTPVSAPNSSDLSHPPERKRDWRMPFTYWADRDTQQFMVKQKEMVSQLDCHNLLLWKAPDGIKYLYNNKSRAYHTEDGPYRPPFYHMDPLEDLYAGADAFVLCPGPSLADTDLDSFKDKLTLCVNSAGFKVPHGLFWVTMESSYLIKVLREQKIDPPPGRTWIQSSRCAVRWRHWGWGKVSRAVYVGRWEEEWILPHRTPAGCVMGALTAAWWMGAKRAFIVGMDLSKKNGPYVRGVPYSEFGASNPFDEQPRTLEQFRMPGMQVFNGSPLSREVVKNFTPISYPEIESLAKEDPEVKHPLDIQK
jgi:hypothetical protein